MSSPDSVQSKTCETCGRQLGGDDPFAVCSQCLFGEALAPRPIVTEAPGETVPGTKRLECFSRLTARRDFFQKYEIIEKIGGGGQGDIWKVWDYDFHRHVAMKRLGDEALKSEPAVYRFLAEAQIASQLDHPGILPIFDVGLDPDDRPFYTTQLLPGTTLADVWLQNRAESKPGQARHLALQSLLRVCEVMAHAHSRGVIHRDLKPTNILVGAHGDVRVIDWGSAKVLEAARKDFEESFVQLNREVIQTDRGLALSAGMDSPLATASTGQPVTVLFMPPEILSGNLEELGPQTDVYSLGVMLYELLSARPPYAGPDGRLPAAAELRRLIIQGSPPELRRLNRHISLDLAAICQKAMAHHKPERYGTMQELAEDIQAALEVRPVQARKPGACLKLQKWTQRNLSYVIPGGAALVLLSAAFFITRGLKAERDVAEQLTALRSAELAGRSGHWREALQHWNEAEAAGYGDVVQLGLHRAEAWTVLNEPARSEALLRRLARRADLGGQRGEVLLRFGEHELFDQGTGDLGARHVREAMSAGLTTAEQSFARGLLAGSTPEALEYFRGTLQLDPYHHGAHRHSLGLEFLLGRHQELAAHIRIFKVLFPDDPSPGFLEAAELALQGRGEEAHVRLGTLRDAANPDLYERLDAGLRALATAAESYDLKSLLAAHSPPEKNPQPPGSAVALNALQDGLKNTAVFDAGTRLPQLPCVRAGILEGNDALASLAIPFLSDPKSAVAKVKASWRHHPEAMLPTLAGLLLDSRPSVREKPPWLLQLQADLFQLAADSPSVMPNLGKLSLYLAARTESELTGLGLTNSAAARLACLENLRRLSAMNDVEPVESRAFFDLAFDLGDFELSRTFLLAWKKSAPDDLEVSRYRGRLDIATGALGGALEQLDRTLAAHPDDQESQTQKNFVIEKLQRLLESAHQPSAQSPATP